MEIPRLSFFRLANQQDQPFYLCVYSNLVFYENKYLGGAAFDTLLARSTQAVVYHRDTVSNNDALVGTNLFTLAALDTSSVTILL